MTPMQDLLTPDLIWNAIFVIFLLFLLRITRPVYLAIKKRGAGYGIVFDAASGSPVALATVRLIDLHNLPVSTAITDKKGRYRLAASRGEYYLDVVKTGYRFPPSQFRENHTSFDNTLSTRHIKVADYGMITKNIPVEPVTATFRQNLLKFRILLPTNLQFLIAYLSPLVIIAYPIRNTDLAPWIIYFLYVGVVLGRIVALKPPPRAFGIVGDARTKRPIEKAVIRIFDAKYNKLLETQITSPRGRYAFVIKPGAYYVQIEKVGFKTIRINFPHIKKEGFVLSRDVSMTLLPQKTSAVPQVTEVGAERMTKISGQFSE